MLRKRLKRMWYWFARWGCQVFCCVFFSLRIHGQENVPDEGAFMLVGNHQSYLDPVFCGMHLNRPLYFLARESLFANWLARWVISSVNTIPVKVGGADLGAMKKIINKLKEGYGVCLFPEGTRTSNGKIMPFKGGFGLLCRRGNATIVPVMVDGAFECWPRHQKVFVPGSRVAICYGKPIPAEEVRSMSDKELAEKLTGVLREMQNNYRIQQGKEPYCY